MAATITRNTSPISPGLSLSNDLNDALTTWSTSQRTVIGLAANFADSGEWMATGALSAAHWIAGIADIEVCTAREWIRVGRRLRVLPLIAELFEADELSYSKVRTLSRIATPENEQQLAAIAAGVPAGALPRRSPRGCTARATTPSWNATSTSSAR